jgi:transposase-like protein
MSNVNCNRCAKRAVVLARVGGNTDDAQSGTQEFLCDDCRRSVPALRLDPEDPDGKRRIPGQLIRLVDVVDRTAL